jgi:hypothetical protein
MGFKRVHDANLQRLAVSANHKVSQARAHLKVLLKPMPHASKSVSSDSWIIVNHIYDMQSMCISFTPVSIPTVITAWCKVQRSWLRNEVGRCCGVTSVDWTDLRIKGHWHGRVECTCLCHVLMLPHFFTGYTLSRL